MKQGSHLLAYLAEINKQQQVLLDCNSFGQTISTRSLFILAT